MAAVVATVSGASLLEGPVFTTEQSGVTTVRKTYSVMLSTAIYTASADTASVTGICDRIKEHTKKGVAMTFRSAMAGRPGKTAAGAAAYISVGSVITNASETLSFQIGGTTAEANTAAATNVELLVLVDEGVAA